ncbi:MAG: hypothetical protein JNK82_26895 [Myxococcaceae bacterium]|nr:hypothetical protein [Myxococcaceae bacterium]
MKRLMLIAAAVLVPFAVLVGWGLSALSDTPPPVPVSSRPAQPPPLPTVVQAEPPPAPRAGRIEPAAEAPVEPPPPVEPTPPEPRAVEPKAAVVKQLEPLVNLCFIDDSARLRQVVRVSTVFEPMPDGTLSRVQVRMMGADPYVTACVQDALEGARLSLPQGMSQGSMRHTFIFNPHPSK